MGKILEDLIDKEKNESALRMLADVELPLEKVAKYAGHSFFLYILLRIVFLLWKMYNLLNFNAKEPDFIL